MKHLSRWMSTQGLAPGDLTAEAVRRFGDARRASYHGLRSPRALVALLAYLRSMGAIPRARTVIVTDPAELLLERFGCYLARERGLAEATVRSYVSQARPFVVEHLDAGWDALTGGQVAAFVIARSLAQPPRSVAVRTNALRCILRWMWREGLLSSPSLADAVGKIAAPGHNVPRRALTAIELERVVTGLPAG